MSSGIEFELSTTGSKVDTASIVDRSSVTPSQCGPDRTNHNSLSSSSELAQTPKQITRERIQFLSLCWTIFLGGWNDSSTGPLLPRIQSVYGVSYLIVSLIFVFACVVGVAIRREVLTVVDQDVLWYRDL